MEDTLELLWDVLFPPLPSRPLLTHPFVEAELGKPLALVIFKYAVIDIP